MNTVSKWRLAAWLLVGAAMAASAARAQTPADEFARERADQERAERLETLRRLTPRSGPAEAGDEAPGMEPGGPCFSVERIIVDGVKQFPPDAIEKIVSPHRNSCVGLAKINELLRALTHLYLDKGYITSRAYVPEQDIAATKTLRLVVVEGTLADIYVNGKPPALRGTIATAFPGMKGEIVNIRDMEQGLDQINRLASNDAKTNLLPGPDEGTSILNVENEPAAPWHFSMSNSNLGQEQTGYWKSAYALRIDNLAELNDLLALTYEHTGDHPGGDGQGTSDSFSGSFSIPYGYWTFSLNGSYYHYESAVPGLFGPIETSGNSKQAGLGVERVVRRDKDSITTVNAALTYKETNNFLLGSRIEVGSRRYTVGSLSISHSRRMLGGLWVFDAAYDQGLDLLGAVDPGDPGAGDADPRFSKFTATLSVLKPFAIGDQRLEASTLVSGQYSPDNLFGAEQISLGSYSNVRGTRESVLFGNRGFFTRNELAWRTMPWAGNATAAEWLGELRPYAALDYGRVISQQEYGIDGGDLAGWTAGVKLVGGNLGLDLGYSKIFHGRPPGGDDLFYTSMSLRW
jgi:hemolysin activation/secretion protein